MERATVDVYEQRGQEWIARRRDAPRRGAARLLGDRADAVPGVVARWRADLGCGGGRYLADLGSPVLGIDASRRMLGHAATVAPQAVLVQADLEALPLRAGVLAGGWANNSYLHLPAERLPLALADLHRSMAVGAPLDIQVLAGDHSGGRLAADDLGGRYFCSVPAGRLHDLLTGAGFEDVAVEEDAPIGTDGHRNVRATARRARSLADTVGPHMRLVVCGLNPSEYAADAGVGFARPGNRFWPAALAAGLVSRDRDPRHALVAHGVGMTDLVKRATARSAQLRKEEYRAGLGRITRLVEWLDPPTICFVGLEGYRTAVDRGAAPGWQTATLGRARVYVMPSTSGLNAHARLEDLVLHLRAAAAGKPGR